MKQRFKNETMLIWSLYKLKQEKVRSCSFVTRNVSLDFKQIECSSVCKCMVICLRKKRSQSRLPTKKDSLKYIWAY